MTIKLTHQQAEALYNLFTGTILKDAPADMAESLLMDLMTDIYKKLRNKMEAKLPKSGYSLNVSDKEAKAYYLYFTNRYLGTQYLYESNFIQGQLNDINRQLA